ncbi:MAG: RtcB family protein [Verrucomicrobia bacterium]|nr:RtcB family protein [Verrucomicrobiota bacterium]MCF7708686.1 RtcB family protein [Verrucomicrobiota bacterium]
MNIEKKSDYLWEIPRSGGMNVPARIYATEKMMKSVLADNAPDQAVNVAHLPGIVGASLAMPDIHWGYGFPIGGVAAFDMDTGIISPGGVGYDINCGVRLMSTRMNRKDLTPHLHQVITTLYNNVPSGVGSSGVIKTSISELRKVVTEGAAWAVRNGFGSEQELDYIEEQGCIAGADPDAVQTKPWERGKNQLGTLGSGNHFLEVGYISQIFNKDAADVFGLFPDQITITIHCGSRGFGYQVCDDFLSVMNRAVRKYEIELPDRQLACAPINSPEGRAYLGAMRCAINYGFANRQAISHLAKEAVRKALGGSVSELGLRTVYEVAHNIAKLETHTVDGVKRRLCVHRKGATRAFPAGHEEIPQAYRHIGQPVLIPGDMGRSSYVLMGAPNAMMETFGSTCHGAGRLLSRMKAKKAAQGRNIVQELASKGIVVRGQNKKTLNEELSDAYKDVTDVVDACDRAGISKKVAEIQPLGCIKG